MKYTEDGPGTDSGDSDGRLDVAANLPQTTCRQAPSAEPSLGDSDCADSDSVDSDSAAGRCISEQ